MTGALVIRAVTKAQADRMARAAQHEAAPAHRSGGVGLNVGLQDATNLGWKLAAVIQGRADAELLDTYQAERHPVGAELAVHTLAQGALITQLTPEITALRGLLNEAIASEPTFAGMLAAPDQDRAGPRAAGRTRYLAAASGEERRPTTRLVWRSPPPQGVGTPAGRAGRPRRTGTPGE